MPKDFVEYPELDRVIELFPILKKYLACADCCKCTANGGQKNGNLTGHHLFPDRHWKRNKFIILLCMKNGKNDDGRVFCHNEIERQIKEAEERYGVVYNPKKGKRLRPIDYCQLTVDFLKSAQIPQAGTRKVSRPKRVMRYTNRPPRVQSVPTGCVPLSKIR